MIRPIKPNHNSILATKPISMPKGLIYRPKNGDRYKLIETKTGRVIGKMVAFPTKSDSFEENFYNISPNKDIFYINSLEIVYWKRRQGWGEYCMDFAKRESFRRGCEGRTFLVAYEYERPPQLFYKKQGFVAVDKEMDKKLDLLLEQGLSPHRCGTVDMYLPLEEMKKYNVPRALPEVKKGFVQTVKEFFKKHFS